MSRIIINNRSSLNDANTLLRVLAVIKEGRISDDNKQYCFAVKFEDCAVYSTMTKAGSDTFYVTDLP